MGKAAAVITGSSGESSSNSEDDWEHRDQADANQELEVEDWVTWLQRTTRTAINQLRKLGLDDWVAEQKKKKWALAGHTARRWDGRWSTALLHWTPDGLRKVGGPKKRWTQCIEEVLESKWGVARGDWTIIAQDRDTWKYYSSAYTAFTRT